MSKGEWSDPIAIAIAGGSAIYFVGEGIWNLFWAIIKIVTY